MQVGFDSCRAGVRVKVRNAFPTGDPINVLHGATVLARVLAFGLSKPEKSNPIIVCETEENH